MPKRLHGLLLCAVLILLPGCSEPSLNVVCSDDESICRAWASEFTTESKIPVNYVRLPTSEALARIQASRHTPEFDVWVGGPSENYVVAEQGGLLQPVFLPHSVHIPHEFKSSAGYEDGPHTWVGVYASMLALCSNPDVLANQGLPVPEAWTDLEDPRFSTWISASSPLTSGSAYTVMLALAKSYPDDAVTHLETIYDNVAHFTRSGTSPAPVVAHGEAAVAISFAPYCQRATTSSGAALIVKYPREGTTFEVGSGAILANAKHSDQARHFLDWIISESGQRIVADNYQMPVSSELPHNLLSVLAEPHTTVFSLNSELAASQRDDWLSWFTHIQLGG